MISISWQVLFFLNRFPYLVVSKFAFLLHPLQVGLPLQCWQIVDLHLVDLDFDRIRSSSLLKNPEIISPSSKRTSAFPARMWANDSSRYITAISIFSCASSKMSFTSFIFLLFEVAFSLKLCKYNCFTTDYTDLHRLFYPIICVNLNPYPLM